MTCDLLVRSYWKDLEWLGYSLASIRTFCTGFRSTVVILPSSSAPWLKRCPLPKEVRIKLCRDYKDDYLGQQVTKLLADTYSDADYICHLDSDCVFFRPTSPDDFIVGGKPIVLKRASETLGRHYPWRQATEKFLGCTVSDDFMQYPPFTFPRWLYGRVREHALRMHGVDVETYVTAQPVRGFSEYNALGAFAWRHHRNSFLWTDTTASPLPEPNCHWYWSWGGLDEAIRAEISDILYVSNARTS